jgi:hypothetical protein
MWRDVCALILSNVLINEDNAALAVSRYDEYRLTGEMKCLLLELKASVCEIDCWSRYVCIYAVVGRCELNFGKLTCCYIL